MPSSCVNTLVEPRHTQSGECQTFLWWTPYNPVLMCHVLRNMIYAIISWRNVLLTPQYHMRWLTLTHSVGVACSSQLHCQLSWCTTLLGQIMTVMLPLLMMRHWWISCVKWWDSVTSTGKHWIKQVSSLPLHSLILLADPSPFFLVVTWWYATRKISSIYDWLPSWIWQFPLAWS